MQPITPLPVPSASTSTITAVRPFAQRSASWCSAEALRVARFALVGLSGTLLDLALLALFKIALGLPTLPANVLSYSVGILNNFTLNHAWTFREARPLRGSLRGSLRYVLRQFAQFASISLIGLALNTALLLTLEAPFAALLGQAYAYLPAKLLATALVFVWNFGANRLWTFRTCS